MQVKLSLLMVHSASLPLNFGLSLHKSFQLIHNFWQFKKLKGIS